MAEPARAATSEDLRVVGALARQAVAELSTLRGGPLWARQQGRREPIEDRLAAEITGPLVGGQVVVGLVDSVVVGYGVSRLDVLPDGARLAVVSDLYVDPQARGIGIGEAMMDLLVAHAQAHGAVGIDSLALPGDRSTKNFFETFGLKARALLVHRSFGDDPTEAPPAAPEPST